MKVTREFLSQRIATDLLSGKAEPSTNTLANQLTAIGLEAWKDQPRLLDALKSCLKGLKAKDLTAVKSALDELERNSGLLSKKQLLGVAGLLEAVPSLPNFNVADEVAYRLGGDRFEGIPYRFTSRLVDFVDISRACSQIHASQTMAQASETNEA